MNESGGIVELLQTAKPLIFENTEAEWRYSIKGTCFMARFGFRYYAITAKTLPPQLGARVHPRQIESWSGSPVLAFKELTTYH